MGAPVIQSSGYARLTATGNIANQRARMAGCFVASASTSPTITVYDSATTGTATTVIGVFTPIAGTFYPLPFTFGSGVYVVIAGTVDVTFALEIS